MQVLRRIEQQVDVVKELGLELTCESSYRGLERLVQLTIQALLDLGLMVLSAMGFSPKGYGDVASLLGQLGVLGSNDAKLLKAMAGLRNVLVHAYVSVSREIVDKASKKLPEDATKIADKILSSARQRLRDPQGITDEIIDALREVLKDRVIAAFIFGSWIKGYGLKGDVDVAVYLGRRPDPYEVGALMADLCDALGRDDVDFLVIDDCDNVALAYEAVQGRPVVGDEAEILWLRTKIASQYMDYKEKISRIKATAFGTSSS